ncbi:MAG: hypothetical protein ABW252_13100 [Polyangiales bacterium]
MVPSFFGSRERPLFGIYHPPAGSRTRDVGVLLCYPAPQEYMRTYWAFRKLAHKLAQEGFHVFRFDYLGTGDSSGDSAEVSLAGFRESLVGAARELRDVAHVQKLSAVGFRLGAALAASARDLPLHDLVLWEPVVRGARYVDELRQIQASELAEDLRPPFRVEDAPRELLGFPFPEPLERELRALDLTALPAPRASRVAVMVSNDAPAFRELAQVLAQRGLSAVYRHVPDEGARSEADLGAALLASNMLDAIVALLASPEKPRA